MLPFIEINGEEIADSNMIIETLSKKFDKVAITACVMFAYFYEICSRTGNARRADSGSEERPARHGRHGWEPSSLVSTLALSHSSNCQISTSQFDSDRPLRVCNFKVLLLAFLCKAITHRHVLWLRPMIHWLFNTRWLKLALLPVLRSLLVLFLWIAKMKKNHEIMNALSDWGCRILEPSNESSARNYNRLCH